MEQESPEQAAYRAYWTERKLPEERIREGCVKIEKLFGRQEESKS